MFSGCGVEIVAATREVELAMIRCAFERHRALQPLLDSLAHAAHGGAAISIRSLGPLRARDLAECPIGPREEGSPLLLFFHSSYGDAVSAYLEGEPPAEPAQTADAIERLVERFAPPRAIVLLFNVFRHVAPTPDRPPSEAARLRDRIRRFNREALRMALARRVVLVDVDEAMAREGARALGCDHACGSALAIERGARAVADAILTHHRAPAAGDPG